MSREAETHGAIRTFAADQRQQCWRAAGVDRFQVDAGKELLARHRAECLLHTGGSDVAALFEECDELVAEHGGASRVGAGLGGFHYSYPTVGGAGRLIAGSGVG